MEYTVISGTEMNVSRIAQGTWAIGGWMWGGTDERESIRTIHAALDKGINLIDTAPVYVSGFPKKLSQRQLRSGDIGKRFSSRPKLASSGTTARFRETPRAIASGRRSKIRSVDFARTTSTSIKSIGRIWPCRSKKPPGPCRLSTRRA